MRGHAVSFGKYAVEVALIFISDRMNDLLDPQRGCTQQLFCGRDTLLLKQYLKGFSESRADAAGEIGGCIAELIRKLALGSPVFFS